MEFGAAAPVRSEAEAAIATIRLVLPQGALRRWHKTLAERLSADGHRVLVAIRRREGAPPPSTALIEMVEGLLYASGGASPCDPVAPGDWALDEGGDADLLFDLTGSSEPQADAIVPLYDGEAGEAARDAVLLDGRAPWIELATTRDESRQVHASALPAIARPELLRCGREAAADRTITLIVKLGRARPRRAERRAPGPRPRASGGGAVSRRLARRRHRPPAAQARRA